MKTLFLTPIIGSLSMVSVASAMETVKISNSVEDSTAGGGRPRAFGMSKIQNMPAPARPSSETPRMSLKERCLIEKDKGKSSKFRINNILENGKDLPYKMDLELIKQRAECGRLINSRDGTFDATGVVSTTLSGPNGYFQKREDIGTKISTYRRNKAFLNKNPNNEDIKKSQETAALNIFFFFKHEYPEYRITQKDIENFPEIPLKEKAS